MPDKDVVRIAAMSDIHCGKASGGTLQAVFSRVASEAHILILAGDLTDYGLPEEAKLLLRELAPLSRMPVVAVLGNHDFEAGRQDEIRDILLEGGVKVLDGDSFESHGVGFAGVKGFCGGFGRGALGPWGEQIIKQFVHAAVDEALKLETALARLRTPQRMAILHYAPIRDTVEGEPPEIFSYLGSSRLEEPLSRYPVTVVVHGHAHNGAPEGQTQRGVPVYNVAMPLLRRLHPDRPPFRLIEIAVAAADQAADGAVNAPVGATSAAVAPTDGEWPPDATVPVSLPADAPRRI